MAREYNIPIILDKLTVKNTVSSRRTDLFSGENVKKSAGKLIWQPAPFFIADVLYIDSYFKENHNPHMVIACLTPRKIY